jgi:hypothetical protein
MDAKALKSISSQIYRRFPEVAGSQPKIRLQSGAQPAGSSQTFVITFRGTATASNGKSIPRLVRVTANAQGKILKVTTSR